MHPRFPLLVILGMLLPRALVAQRLSDAATGARAVAPVASFRIADGMLRAGGLRYARTGAVTRRNHWKGALYGTVIGAVVGGIGLAVASYALTTSSPKNEYVILALLDGGVAGAAAGALVGVVVGVPERRESRPESERHESRQ